ncbi:LOW QUALITY PROTEIN: macrophage migration inhibitory factor [Anabrus simplex]|uniref:LOW QUALITY PROTEIN: macrophage migration inhibitory factor n=1 Tax=Anabrus simplex TaxID=316456 RepID=UPI0034DCCEA8
MPVFHLQTNVPKNKIPADFLKQTTALMSQILGKPQSYCVAVVVPDTLMMHGTSSEPCGILRFGCIGRMGVEENKKLSAALFQHVEKNIGIAKDKMYITFSDSNPANVGYKGTTFHEIFKTDTSAK